MYIYSISNRNNYELYIIANDLKTAIDLYIKNLNNDDNKDIESAFVVGLIDPKNIQNYY